MNKTILVSASLLGATSIILGAFAAHGLKEFINVAGQQTFETGVRYQMYHAILLLFVGSTSLIQQKAKAIIYCLALVGVLFFSGSIYGLATNELTNFDFKSIGLATPIGGLLLILSWGMLFVNVLKIKGNK